MLPATECLGPDCEAACQRDLKRQKSPSFNFHWCCVAPVPSPGHHVVSDLHYHTSILWTDMCQKVEGLHLVAEACGDPSVLLPEEAEWHHDFAFPLRS